jgi:molecular chaperone GrpE (heat shock protein)
MTKEEQLQVLYEVLNKAATFYAMTGRLLTPEEAAVWAEDTLKKLYPELPRPPLPDWVVTEEEFQEVMKGVRPKPADFDERLQRTYDRYKKEYPALYGAPTEEQLEAHRQAVLKKHIVIGAVESMTATELAREYQPIDELPQKFYDINKERRLYIGGFLGDNESEYPEYLKRQQEVEKEALAAAFKMLDVPMRPRREDGSYAEIDNNGVVTVRNKDGGMLMQMCREDWEALRGLQGEEVMELYKKVEGLSSVSFVRVTEQEEHSLSAYEERVNELKVAQKELAELRESNFKWAARYEELKKEDERHCRGKRELVVQNTAHLNTIGALERSVKEAQSISAADHNRMYVECLRIEAMIGTTIAQEGVSITDVLGMHVNTLEDIKRRMAAILGCSNKEWDYLLHVLEDGWKKPPTEESQYAWTAREIERLRVPGHNTVFLSALDRLNERIHVLETKKGDER